MVSKFEDTPIIAPFWSDIDLRNAGNTGKVYQRCESRKSHFTTINSRSKSYFDKIASEIKNNIDFDEYTPTLACTITWSNVSPSPYTQQTASQVIPPFYFFSYIRIYLDLLYFFTLCRKTASKLLSPTTTVQVKVLSFVLMVETHGVLKGKILKV